jgi:frataxin-like iron-binding protein CyaY/exonuclease VII small subunit
MPGTKAEDEAKAAGLPPGEGSAGAAKKRWKRYGEAKEFKGRSYHGMKVGGVHHWTYPDGKWTERKVQPDRWDVTYTSLKRRNKKAPRNSGAEVGSGYHWFITAHQWVEKLDANTYATHLEGSKYLVAFKKPDWPVWNTQFRNAKRKAKERTIAALQDAIRRIEEGSLDLEDPQQKDALADLVAHAAEVALEQDAAARTIAPLKDGKDGEDEEEGGVAPATRRRGAKRPVRRRSRSRRQAATAR